MITSYLNLFKQLLRGTDWQGGCVYICYGRVYYQVELVNLQFGLVQIVKIQQRNQLMSETVPSKKWVDYTDQESSEDQQSQSQHQDTPLPQKIPSENKPKESKKVYKPTKMQIDDELDKLDDLDYDRVDEVWLLMTSQDEQYLEKEINYLKSKAKRGGNIVAVYPSNTTDTYEVKVYINIAYDYISKGYDNTDLMKVTVAQKNFTRKEESKGRGKKNNDYKQGDKKRYVDKETGLQPTPKIKKTDSIPTDNDRKYSKQQAEKKGEELANFRTKLSKKESEDNGNAEGVKEEGRKGKQQVKQEVKKEVEQAKVETKQQPKQQAKQQVKQQGKKGKVEKKKSKGGSKYKSQNRFEGIQDLD